MDQAITRAAGAAPRAVGEFQGYVDGVDGVKPSVRWLDRKNMPQVGDKLYALPARAAVPRTWAILLTSANHGTVGPVGSTFPHAGEKHERVQVMEIVEAGAAPAPHADLVGLVCLDVVALIDSLDEVYSWAHDLPIPTRGAVTAMRKVRQVKETLAAAPVAAQAGQVAVPEDSLRVVRRLLDGSQPQDVPGALMVIESALKGASAWTYDIAPPPGFLEYVQANYNGDVNFHDPAWHAKRLWNAAMRNAKPPFVAAPAAPAVVQQAPAADALDAARYRWLCQHGHERMPEAVLEAMDAAHYEGEPMPKDLIDQVIDKERAVLWAPKGESK